MNEGLAFADQNYLFTFVNDRFCEMLGHSRDEMIGHHLSEFVHDDDKELMKDQMARRRKGEAKRFELAWKARDGSKIYTLASPRGFFDAEGRLTGSLGVLTDITGRKEAEEALQQAHDELELRVEQRTAELARANEQLKQEIRERRRAEEKLRESEERYRGLVDNIAIGVSLISPNMEILTINKQMKDWFPHIDPEKRPLCYRSFNNPPREEVCSYCPTILTLKDGEVHEAITETPAGDEIRNYRIISSPIKDRGGQVVGAIESVEDITERKQAQEQLLTYQQQLRSLASELVLTEARERRRLATDLHDSVGQFLAISKLKVDALTNDTSAAEFAGDLNEIGELTGQAIQQTRSLTFDLSPPVLYELGLEAALEALAERMRQQHPICIEVADDRNPKSLSEDLSVLLYRAVRELLINIVKHARARNARTSIETDHRELRITVEDDGAGFDISEIDSLNNRVGKFGLFSIRERLNHLGGRFEIASKPGQGTQITLVAPLGPDY